MDKITGLTIGADDYVTKPFNPLELVARVKAQLRRSTRYNAGAAPESHVIDFSGLEINKDTHECRLYDQPVDLTPTEFSLLWMLCQNRGKVLSAEELFEGVWGEKYLDSNNTVMVHIRRLREKLHEPARNPKFIKTVWGCLLYTSSLDTQVIGSWAPSGVTVAVSVAVSYCFMVSSVWSSVMPVASMYLLANGTASPLMVKSSKVAGREPLLSLIHISGVCLSGHARDRFRGPARPV